MSLKKIYNGHYRRVPSSSSKKSELTQTDYSKRRMTSEQYMYEHQEERKIKYGIIDNVIYGAGIGIGAIGLALALVSSTVLASTLVLSTYLCVNTCTCNTSEEEVIEVEYS